MSGKLIESEQALTALVALAQKSNKAAGAAEIYMQLGEFYFYRQDYVKRNAGALQGQLR